MFEKLKALAARLDELEIRLSAPDLYDDPDRAAKLLRERNELEPIVTAFREYEQARRTLADATEMLSDPDMKELAQEELQQAKSDIARLEDELKILLLPKDPNDEKNIYVEIRGGAGGEESALFAADLYRMYTMYADKRGWQTEVMNKSETELGGYKEVVFRVAGDKVYSRLKFESGVHRVQRVPETESQGRVHTSTTTVAVLPEAEELDFYIDPKDLRIDTFRASGAGGQHINKTSSAIRVTHIPTNTVVECQDERSQHKNKEKALSVLRSRLYEAEVEKQRAAIAADRKSQVGTGDRSERIRTYNFPENRVSDHRIKLTIYKLDQFLNGDMDEILDALIAADTAAKAERAERNVTLELDFGILIVPVIPLVLGLALQLSVEVGHIAEFYAADDLGAGGEQHTDVKPFGHALVNARRALRAAGLGLRAVGDVAHLADVRQECADGIAVIRVARLLDASDKIADLERLTSVIVLKAGDRDENVLVLCHAKHSFLL